MSSNVVDIEVQTRNGKGTSVSRRLRKEGFIPAVAYCLGNPSAPVLLSEKEFVKTASSSLPSRVFRFKSNSSDLDGKNAIVKDIQREPVKGAVLHVDFQILTEGKAITMAIPLRFVGDPVGVKNQGGVFAATARDIILSCAPDAIPEIIEINVTKLGLGERIRACDISVPAGATLAGNPLEALASVIAGRAARTAEAEEKAGAAPAAAPAAKK
jgi:large subunit ribosomal protein L25